LLPTKGSDGGIETDASTGKFLIHRRGRLMSEISEQCLGKFIGAEKCLGFVLLATVHRSVFGVVMCRQDVAGDFLRLAHFAMVTQGKM
jgi:hypothetical protein